MLICLSIFSGHYPVYNRFTGFPFSTDKSLDILYICLFIFMKYKTHIAEHHAWVEDVWMVYIYIASGRFGYKSKMKFKFKSYLFTTKGKWAYLGNLLCCCDLWPCVVLPCCVLTNFCNNCSKWWSCLPPLQQYCHVWPKDEDIVELM